MARSGKSNQKNRKADFTLVEPPLSDTIVREFKELCGWLSRLYAIELPVPPFESVKMVKQFCSGLLDPSTPPHPWRPVLAKIPLRERLSVSGSLFLFRKRLPSPRPNIRDYIKDMSVPSPDPPDGYIAFVKEQVGRLFPFGWDRRWSSYVKTTTVSTSSTLEAGRGEGGGRCMIGNGFSTREEFCDSVLQKHSSWRPRVGKARVAAVLTGGKWRRISVNSVDMTALAPVHQIVYDRLSEEEWMLRGDAKARRFASFVKKEGEIFVSGDYESATDNLNQEVSQIILGTILRNCVRIPPLIREASMDTLSCSLFAAGDSFAVPVKRGTLMGNALSFPLLCLNNYLAFKYLVPRDVPVKINGDDIVFRSTRSEFDRWSAGVEDFGLKLSLGKTMVHDRAFSLNSTFFTSSPVRVRLAPVIRSTSFFSPVEDPHSLAGRFDTIRGFDPKRRSFLGAVLLRKHRKAIWWTQRSVRNGLGIRVNDDALRSSGLWRREWFYTTLPREPPLPKLLDGWVLKSIPDGWARVPWWGPVNMDSQRQFYREVVETAWNPVRDEAKDTSVREGTIPYRDPLDRRGMRLLGWTRFGAYRRWLFSSRPYIPQGVPGKKRWVKVGVEDKKELVGVPDELSFCFSKAGVFYPHEGLSETFSQTRVGCP